MPHVTSLRLPEDLYEAAKPVARRRGMSFNALVEEALRKELALEQEREMYDAASLLGSDPESGVEFAAAAQADLALED